VSTRVVIHPAGSLQSRAVSGTYAEPGTQTFQSSGRRDQVMALCRNCGYEIAFFNASDRGDWKHLVSGEHQCGAEALVAQA
jgi:hypothetical protein